MEVFFKSETIVNIIELYTVFNRYNTKDFTSIDISYLEAYLTPILSKQSRLEFLDYYKFQTTQSNSKKDIDKNQLFTKCNDLLIKLKSELDTNQKFELYIACLEYSLFIINENNTSEIETLLDLIFTTFNLNHDIVHDIKCFCKKDTDLIKNKENIIVAGDFKRIKPKTYNIFQSNYLNGNIWFFFIEPLKAFLFQYTGTDTLILNNQSIFKNRIYYLSLGGIIEGDNIDPIFYSELLINKKSVKFESVDLEVREISKTFKNTNQGIKPLSFEVTAGNLMAIIGTSGSGKTTLLNLLNGNLKTDQGSILINGYNLNSDYEVIRKHLGYVPQDDLLIEELTVFQNLLINANLCRDNLSHKERIELVTQTLYDLDLYEVKDLRVGNPLNKIISGGQRKRLNIAFEIIRQPTILFLDEPTSGLSSSDAYSVINLLKNIALTGKIVIINIHQPTSDIFYLFDKLLVLDQLGYATYFGNPIWAVKHFKKLLEFEDSALEDNIKLGNFSPERIFHLMYSKSKDKDGNATNKRIYDGKEWNKHYLKSHIATDKVKSKQQLPSSLTKKPNSTKQFAIFTLRNFMTRGADLPYILLLLLSSPVLAFMMSYFLKSTDFDTHQYSFINNDNIPVYLFISVIISIFQGLIISSAEIFRDLKILKRESFLNLNPLAYLNSKLVYVLIINAYHIGTYVLIGNAILEIKALFWYYFIVLWVTASSSSLIGLFISTRFKSMLSIYITIPFILIPKILLAGAILDYDKIHHTLSSPKYVPVYADFTISRWAYESIVDIQFSLNKYDNEIYNELINKSTFQYYIYFTIPFLKEEINSANYKDGTSVNEMVKSIFEELLLQFPALNKSIKIDEIDFSDQEKLNVLIKKIEKWLKLNLRETNKSIDIYRANLKVEKKDYYNKKLAEFALGHDNMLNYIERNNELVRKYQPCYHIPDNSFGRSHYFAPYKKVGAYYIKTWKFNTLALLLYGLLFYLLTLKQLIKKRF
ncbi:ATP-binding cassette domain-containing protein [Carboxylicivirga caseinilyticus]|uniref:ATP-binding cassette domain-containing protein n=1 Tax=Carboxylicivirga caseinilyticus TaxID=3417572 RepID=UPI003D35928A|nr:ATP-binding cassette domain-containing protein [Marinilabiliaceae bacterium A049]